MIRSYEVWEAPESFSDVVTFVGGVGARFVCPRGQEATSARLRNNFQDLPSWPVRKVQLQRVSKFEQAFRKGLGKHTDWADIKEFCLCPVNLLPSFCLNIAVSPASRLPFPFAALPNRFCRSLCPLLLYQQHQERGRTINLTLVLHVVRGFVLSLQETTAISSTVDNQGYSIW